jgi:phosphoribosylformylglycinamidine synthase
VLSIPVKHTSGRYYVPDDQLADVNVVFRYAHDGNPNGSTNDIAGVANAEGNVVGLMPHPEHAVDELTGSADGPQALRVGRACPRLTSPRSRASRTPSRSA